MKSVLISICPKWCEKICRGEKTIEVRKTRPKLQTPFKCYIYRTKGTVPHIINDKGETGEGDAEMKYNCCVGCKWHDEFTWACFNGDSEHCADFVNCGCPLYEVKKDDDETK